MKVFDLLDDQGRVFAFEVPNSLLTRGLAARIAQRVPGVTVVRPVRRPFSAGEDPDEFFEFQINLTTFVIWEPWGDSSRFWIGSQPPGPSHELDQLRSAFVNFSPFLHPASLLMLLLWLLLILAVLRPFLAR